MEKPRSRSAGLPGFHGGTSDGSGENRRQQIGSCRAFVIKPTGVGFGRRPLAVHKKPGLAREAGPGFLSAGSALTPVTYVRTTGLDSTRE